MTRIHISTCKDPIINALLPVILLFISGCSELRTVTQQRWATYTNEYYRFAIDYPPEVSIFELGKDGSTIQIQVDSSQPFILSARLDYLPGDVLFFLDKASFGQRRIGDIIWSEYSLAEGYCDGPNCSPSTYALQTELDGTLFSISFPEQSTTTELQKSVLATFRSTQLGDTQK